MLIILQVDTLFKVIQIIALSIAKLIIAPPVSIEMGLGYFETVAITAIGGIIGIFIFYHLSGMLIRFYKINIRPLFKKMINANRKPETLVEKPKSSSQGMNLSSFRTKHVLKKINKKWGLIGICSFTLIAIPLVSFFANRYYRKNKYTLVYLSVSVVLWSFVITTLSFFVL
ncbi:MAG TPA: hypothetical protein PKW80_16030 [Bacteroidales bacterium]|nr:hypothetical protein [Bacteroidales bacterium]